MPALLERPAAAELSDDDILASDLSSEMEFDAPAPTAGTKLFQQGRGDQQFSATSLGESSALSANESMVQIYQRDGTPVVMRRDWAILRLRKVHTGGPYRGQKVFFQKPPQAAPVPSFPCPLIETHGCPSERMLFSPAQAEAHFRIKHKAAWSDRETARAADIQLRGIAATEQMSKAMTALLERMEAGGTVAREEVDATLGVLPFEPTTEELTEEQAAVMALEAPKETWTRQQLLKYLTDNKLPSPDDWMHMKQTDVWAYVKELLEL